MQKKTAAGLEKNISFFAQFTGRVKAVIQCSVSFASIGCVRDAVVLEIDRNNMVSLNVRLL